MSAIYHHSPWYVYDGAFITSLISLPTFEARVSPVSVVIAILAAVKRAG